MPGGMAKPSHTAHKGRKGVLLTLSELVWLGFSKLKRFRSLGGFCVSMILVSWLTGGAMRNSEKTSLLTIMQALEYMRLCKGRWKI